MANSKNSIYRLQVGNQIFEESELEKILQRILKLVAGTGGNVQQYKFVHKGDPVLRDPLVIDDGGDVEMKQRLAKFNEPSALNQRRVRMQIVKNACKNGWEAIAKKYGLEYNDYRELAQKKMVEIIERSRVCVRARCDVAISILRDGRFKSQFETGTSGGTKDEKIRSSSEFEFFGFEDNTRKNKKLRPIYGFMCTYEDIGKDNATQYGPVVFVLKNAVKMRTTWCSMDLLRTYVSEIVSGGTVGNPTLLSSTTIESFASAVDVLAQAVDKIEHMTTRICGTPEYPEAQIHGQVHASDIDEVIIDKTRAVSRIGYDDLIEFMKKQGIEYKEI